jgi:hypothetical protein
MEKKMDAILITAACIAMLILGPKLSVWNYRRRERRAYRDLKRRQDAYHAECRRTGQYDY